MVLKSQPRDEEDDPSPMLKVATRSLDFPPPPRASVRLPADWLVNPFSELALMAHAPEEIGGFRSNVFVSHRRFPTGKATQVVVDARREIEGAGATLESAMTLPLELLDINLVMDDAQRSAVPNRVFEFERPAARGQGTSFHVQLVAVTETINPRVSYVHQVTGSTGQRADIPAIRRIVHSVEFRADPFG